MYEPRELHTAVHEVNLVVHESQLILCIQVFPLS
jgi:hypothetical protein